MNVFHRSIRLLIFFTSVLGIFYPEHNLLGVIASFRCWFKVWVSEGKVNRPWWVGLPYLAPFRPAWRRNLADGAMTTSWLLWKFWMATYRHLWRHANDAHWPAKFPIILLVEIPAGAVLCGWLISRHECRVTGKSKDFRSFTKILIYVI